MERIIFPVNASDMTAEFLTRAIAADHPDTRVISAREVLSKVFGDGMASTAGRVVLDVEYAGGDAAILPRRIVIKTVRDFHPPDALYSNEVNFYRHLRRELDIETPVALGGNFDPETRTFGLILGDLGLRSAEFMDVTKEQSLEQVRAVLSTLAKLHAAFWQSPRFEHDLGWIETHLRGGVRDLFFDPDRLPKRIAANVETNGWQREMVQRIGASADMLYSQCLRVQQHQSTLPQTLLHGDMHLGNTYAVGGAGGLVDWQLMARGHFMHDVGYYIITALDVARRRTHERELIAFYLDRLAAEGVRDPPDLDTAWNEYRLIPAWSVYIGWLPCTDLNYGWEIAVIAHLRVTTAYEDLETAKAIAALD